MLEWLIKLGLLFFNCNPLLTWVHHIISYHIISSYHHIIINDSFNLVFSRNDLLRLKPFSDSEQILLVWSSYVFFIYEWWLYPSATVLLLLDAMTDPISSSWSTIVELIPVWFWPQIFHFLHICTTCYVTITKFWNNLSSSFILNWLSIPNEFIKLYVENIVKDLLWPYRYWKNLYFKHYKKLGLTHWNSTLYLLFIHDFWSFKAWRKVRFCWLEEPLPGLYSKRLN